MQQLPSTPSSEPHLHRETSGVLSRARARWQNAGKRIIASRKHASERNLDAHKVAGREHMQGVDCFDGGKVRCGGETSEGDEDSTKDLIEIKPEVDGRLKDVGRDSRM